MASEGGGSGDDPTGGPAYLRIKDILRHDIASGTFAAGSPFISQRELCERFSVSTTTAVRVLNELAAEGLLVRRRGRGTFVADTPMATATRTENSDRAIACVLHGLGGAYVSEVLRGAESMCTELGYRLTVTDTNESAEAQERALRAALNSGVAGILLYAVQGRAHPGTLAELRRHNVPIVMIDRYRPDVATDAVTVDNVEAGYQLTRHLIELGHRSIATLWHETDCTSVHDRLAGHIRALREAGLPTRPEFTVLQRYWPAGEAHRQAHLRRLIALPEPPTALLCAHGYVLAAAAHDLVAIGVQVPDDIDVA
ncbi:MAG: GntR family transcriptional regulator, partial [Mycobacterium sp.]|nr:GntR family transcriptional regulator [Mycobacterium sp.]